MLEASTNLSNAGQLFTGFTTKSSPLLSFKKHTAPKLVLTPGLPNGEGKSFLVSSTISEGVMILINPKLACKKEKCISDTNGRYIILDILFHDCHIVAFDEGERFLISWVSCER